MLLLHRQVPSSDRSVAVPCCFVRSEIAADRVAAADRLGSYTAESVAPVAVG